MRARATALMIGMSSAALIGQTAMAAIIDYRDTLDAAVAAPDEIDPASKTSHLDLYVGDQFSYDNNIFRLPANTDVVGLPGIGNNPSRSDFSNSITGGLSAEWLVGNRQSFDVDLRADDNRFIHNSDLNNISTNDRAAWNWGLGGVLSGEVGADYSRVLAGFANTQIYSRDIATRTEYFASSRLQVGPRWMVFGGILGSKYEVSDPQVVFNNSTSKAVDLGFDFATNAENLVGFDYRYTDNRSPNAALIGTTIFDPDYREDRARLLVKYALTDKTTIDASGGYLRRQYPSTAIGSFSGEVWRLTLLWQPTAKTQLFASTWQNLAADLSAQTDYYRSRGITVQPIWTASEKITLNVAFSYENQAYIGSNPLVNIPVGEVVIPGGRRDNINTQTGTLTYTPITPLVFTFSVGHEKRATNDEVFGYNDVRATAGFIWKFIHYGDRL
jgi:exopolysaccharide biosynthesis operon protein EpsL